MVVETQKKPVPLPERICLADQLERASTSIVLNIAEGAGKFSPGDKRRYYLSAAGSATECAAAMDILLRLQLVERDVHQTGKALLERVVSMLVKLAKAQGDR